MCVYEGSLYVGAFESDEGKAGGVWRYLGGEAR